MAATKYQLLYRYINEATNIAITNEGDGEYKPVREFYAYPDHAIFSDNSQTKADAEDEQQQMIADANDPSNVKTNMLFAYDGTKRIRHQKWVAAQTGYVVRDWQSLTRTKIGNRGDYSKDFTTLGSATPEDGGTVVCTEAVFKKYFPQEVDCGITPAGGDLSNAYGTYYSNALFWKKIIETTIFQLADTTDITLYKKNGIKNSYFDGTQTWNGIRYNNNYYYACPSNVNFSYDDGTTTPTHFSGQNAQATQVDGYSDAALNSLATGAKIKPSHVLTTEIPGHYEDTTEYPYLIIDTYKSIPMSPWFVHATYGSLEAALEKAKALVDMLGMENIKLIKIVPFDQFIRIS